MSINNEAIDTFVVEGEKLKEAFAVSYELRHARALYFQSRGIKPFYSTGIDDSITSGYGSLDHNGFWEFPL